MVLIGGAIAGTLVGGIAAYAARQGRGGADARHRPVLCFPPIILALAIAAALGIGTRNTIIAMLVVWWPKFARLARRLVLASARTEYVEAALLLGFQPDAYPVPPHHPQCGRAAGGTGDARHRQRHHHLRRPVLPGLGVVPPTPEWGSMVAEGRELVAQWWVASFPGFAILTIVLGFNFLGDGMRDWLDPNVAAALT